MGKRLTYTTDLEKYLWIQASGADLVAHLKMLSCGKQPVSMISMYRFVKKNLYGKWQELTKETYNKYSREVGKKSFASLRYFHIFNAYQENSISNFKLFVLCCIYIIVNQSYKLSTVNKRSDKPLYYSVWNTFTLFINSKCLCIFVAVRLTPLRGPSDF